MKKVLLLVSVLWFAASAMSQTVKYVKPTAESVAWADKEKASVYTDVNAAIVGAASGDQIWIAAGVYALNKSNVDSGKSAILLKDGVTIYGGFVGTEKSVEERTKVKGGKPWEFLHETIIQKDEKESSDMGFFNQLEIFATPIIVDGLILQKNRISEAGKAWPAISIREGATVQNCIIRDNVHLSSTPASAQGVGMLMTGGTIKSSLVQNNVGINGVGIYIVGAGSRVENVTFDGNVSKQGWSNFGGAAIRANSSSNIIGCTFYNNKIATDAGADGKGAAVFSNTAGVNVINCLVFNNWGSDIFYMNGGTLINCTMANNKCKEDVYLASKGSAQAVYNCIIWGDDLGKGAIGAAGVANNAFSGVAHTGAVTLPEGSIIENIFVLDDENTGINADKNYIKFIKPTSFKGLATSEKEYADLLAAVWKVESTSFAIDKGLEEHFDMPFLLDITTDIEGNKRILNDAIDLGAYETKVSTIAIKYVKSNEESTAWAGKENVYTNLASALEAANGTEKDQIWIAAGTYKVNATYTIKEGVNIYGGFIGTERRMNERAMVENGKPWEFMNETIFEKEKTIVTDISYFTQTAKFGTGDITTIIDGIVCQNNEITTGEIPTVKIMAGTMLQNSILRNNQNTTPSATDNKKTTSRGAAAHLADGGVLRNSLVQGNGSTDGVVFTTGAFPSLIDQVTFDGNISKSGWNGYFGSAAVRSNGRTLVMNSTFYNNSNVGGKGAAISSNNATTMIVNCTAYNNIGGNIFYLNNGQIANCLVVNNESKEAVYLTGTGVQGVYNSVVWGNTGAAVKLAKGNIEDVSAVAYTGNKIAEYDIAKENNGTDKAMNYIQFITPTSFAGIATTEAQMAEVIAANWSVEDTSYAIDKGITENYTKVVERILKEFDPALPASCGLVADQDVVGNDRIQDNSIDLGAYETKSIGGGSVGIVDGKKVDGVQVYAYGNQIVIEGEGEISVYDTTGQLITTMASASSVTTIPMTQKGIYIVKVKTDKNIISKKIML